MPLRYPHFEPNFVLVLVLNEMVLVLDLAGQASTSTALRAEYEYEYEKTWENTEARSQIVGKDETSCLG